jgi:hypothetical protein
MTRTPRQRVECVLLEGGHADRVPFTMYAPKLPQCEAERALRNRGLCIVERVSVFDTHRPNVTMREVRTVEDGKALLRCYHETAQGTLTTLQEPAGFTRWTHEYMFKSPDDYAAIRTFLADEQYTPAYDRVARAQAAFGGDAIFRGTFGLEPLQKLISGGILGMEQFCVEWMDHRDEILKLYDILVEKRRQVYPLVAESPVSHANYGGNVTPEIIGRDTFERYYVPHYNEAAEIMHRHGKRIGCHFDANCRLLAAAIAGTALDYIEAFTPAPDTDMTLADARAAWPDKVLWVNFPSSLHLRADDVIAETAHNLVEEADGPDGLIMGITEDIPEERWRNSCRAIMDGLDRHASLHPSRY